MRSKKVQPISPDVDNDFDGELSTSRSVSYKEVIGYDSSGQVLYDVVQRPRYQNGSGFVISYTAKLNEFLRKVSTGSIVRVFLYIAHNQSYGQDGLFGFRCTHRYIEDSLRLDRTTVWDALKFLKDKGLVVENRIGGCPEFMVNPEYVTIGADKSARVREWIRRRGGDVVGGDVDCGDVVRRPIPSIKRRRRDVVDSCDMN